MPVAVVQDWTRGGADTSNYDALHRRILDSGPPEACLVHTAGATPDGGFRIFEVWRSREDFEGFFTDRLMPILRDMGQRGDPPTTTTYELHEFMTA